MVCVRCCRGFVTSYGRERREDRNIRLNYVHEKIDWIEYSDLLKENEFEDGISSKLGLELRTKGDEIILGGGNLAYAFVNNTEQREFFIKLCRIANVSSVRNE